MCIDEEAGCLNRASPVLVGVGAVRCPTYLRADKAVCLSLGRWNSRSDTAGRGSQTVPAGDYRSY